MVREMLARLGAIDNSVARLALQLDVVQRSASRSPEGLPTARRSDFTTRLSECTAASRKDTRTKTSKARRARKARSARTMDALRQGGDELARHIAALEDTLALRRRQEVAVKAARSIEAWWWAEIERWKAAGRKHRHARSIVREAMRRMAEAVTSASDDIINGQPTYTAKENDTLRLLAPKLNVDVDAFLRCKSLSEITLPEGLTTIGKGAFRDCSSLSARAKGAIAAVSPLAL